MAGYLEELLEKVNKEKYFGVLPLLTKVEKFLSNFFRPTP
jgi:hypothetical protein